MNKILKNKKGFSLLEIIVSISVILIGILPIMNLFASTLKEEIASKKKLTAIYLAQEGSEIVRQMRDNNWEAGPPANWDDSINLGSNQAIVLQNCNSSFPGSGFMLQAVSNENDSVYVKGNAYMQCSGGASSNGGVETGFVRTVSISEDDDYDSGNADNLAIPNDYMRIVVTVSHSGTTLYTLTTYLNKWQ